MKEQNLQELPHLLCMLGLLVVVQVGSLQSRSDDGQTFAGLQLAGQRQQTGLLHVLFRVCADQHEQLRPDKENKKNGKKQNRNDANRKRCKNA